MNALNPQDFVYLTPMAILVVVGLLLVVVEGFIQGKARQFLMQLTVAGCIGALIASIAMWRSIGDGTFSMFGGMLIADRFGMFLTGLFSASTALVALMTDGHQAEHRWEMGEFYGLMLLATAGMSMIAMAGDLVTIFLGIETMSLAVYVLCAARRDSRRSSEAAMKYFLMGAFASGFLIYGMALLYGATGTTDLTEIALVLSGGTGALDMATLGLPSAANTPLLVAGVFLLIVAFGFKVALVPFHMWAPDAYEGAPTPVTAFMAAAVKAAAIAAILRVFGFALGGDLIPFGRMGWTTAFAVLAAITMTVGNIAALRQENIKRLLAYSSVSHAGILLVGVVAAGVEPAGSGIASILYYLAAYSVTTIGAFAVVVWVGGRDHERVLVSDMNGLAASRPGAALAMTIFMLSFGGLPPTAGFVGKFVIFKSALQAYDQQLLWLVVIGVLNSIISIFYYLRVVMAMYFRDALGEFKPIRSGAIVFVLVVCAFLVMQMGLMPGRWLDIAAG